LRIEAQAHTQVGGPAIDVAAALGLRRAVPSAFSGLTVSRSPLMPVTLPQ
jgi:hypothetical protein